MNHEQLLHSMSVLTIIVEVNSLLHPSIRSFFHSFNRQVKERRVLLRQVGGKEGDRSLRKLLFRIQVGVCVCVFVSVSVSVHLSVHLSVPLSVHPSSVFSSLCTFVKSNGDDHHFGKSITFIILLRLGYNQWW